MRSATSIELQRTDVAARTNGTTIYAINSREELHNVCPMFASNCPLALRTSSIEIMPT